VKKSNRTKVEALLRRHGVPLANSVTPLARLSIACPALPSCGQALGEAERALPALVELLDKALAEAGAPNAAIRLNMTGCPNGCARPYNSEIGINGRTKSNYDVYIGGSPGFGRMAERLRADVPLADIPALLQPVFASYAAGAAEGEAFGDYCARVGVQQLATLLPEPTARRRRGAASDTAEA
jgi:sulfite reductase (ferredoxin)